MEKKRTAFSQEIITRIEIDAPADKVYSILSDFLHFERWTKDLVFSADAEHSGKLKLTVNDPESGPMKLSIPADSKWKRLHRVFAYVCTRRFLLQAQI